jgi:hypothetical protein
MSLNKSIESGKEKRKPYYGAKAFDSSCRNHGSDTWDLWNRTYSTIKRKMEADDKLKEVNYG